MTRLWAVAALLLLGLAGPARAGWTRFRIIEWQSRDAAALVTLKRLGVTGAMVIANRQAGGVADPGALAALRAAGMRGYVENIATDFYSAYHIFTPGRPPNWRFAALQRRARTDPSDRALFIRDPSLSDPVWLHRIEHRLEVTVRATRSDSPLFYNLGDETGIADLAAFWDFDLAPASLAGFRAWLRTQYPSLAALNREWGTRFVGWADVQPELTNAAMRRTDGNFAAWSDFKAWMDVAFGRALRAGTDAVHRANPRARAAIEGAQVPGWGGYDYTLLAHSVDVIEIYDGDANLAILRSLNPRVIPLVTSGGADPADLHWIWREWLRGARGLILWDAASAVVRPDGSLGPAGRAYAPVFAALRGSLGAAVLAARPVYDPVAVLYSPASFRIVWMLDHQPKGEAWMRRTAAVEDTGNAERLALAADVRAFRRLGLAPRVLGPAQLGHGGLMGVRMLVLPHAIALSGREARAIRRFSAAGGMVAADVLPATFDAHGRRRARSPLAGIFARSGLAVGRVKGRAIVVPAGDAAGLATAAVRAGIRPRFSVQAPGHDITSYVFRDGADTILALQRTFAAGVAGEQVPGEQVRVRLPGPRRVKDLLGGRDLGRRGTVTLTLGTVTPAVLRIGPRRPR